MQNLKDFIIKPFNYGVSCLNYLQDKISNQYKPEEHEGVQITLEEKEEKMSSEDLVTSKNYPLDIHYVTTKDGYILKLYRIPGGKNEKMIEKSQIKKQAVLFIHGVLDSSDGLISNDEDKCLPYILANLGYDVWLGNSRGNKHSRNHLTLNPDEKEFWNFSFHEMGLYDIPAFVDHILLMNKFSEKIIYIGHSQGTAQVFAALSENYDYMKNTIKLFIAMGPVAKTHSIDSTLMHLCDFIKMDQICLKLGFHEIFCYDDNFNKFGTWVLPKMPSISNMLLELLSDKGASINNQRRMSVFLSRLPSGSSLKSINHLVQLYRNKRFCTYDEGPEKNKELYGQEDPKEYDLKKVKDFPCVILYGKQDRLASPTDVEWLIEELGDNVIFKQMYEEMGHTTFMMANDISWFFVIVKIMDMYKTKSENEA